jgi:mycotoxin biosynthesis protein UstYa
MVNTRRTDRCASAYNHVDENIRIEPEVIKSFGREDISVKIPDGDGYIGTLNVYHEIHCLVRNLQRVNTSITILNFFRNVCINICIKKHIGKI